MRKIYENWKPVLGFEGKYEINNWGECKSIARTRIGKSGSLAPVPEKYLKGKKDKDGYIVYALCSNGEAKFFRAHRLVAEAFIPNPYSLPQINHINGNRDMNLVDNLEWISSKENTSLNKADGKKRTPVVVNGVWYPSIRECSRELNVDPSNIRYWIKTGKASYQ